MKQLVLKNPRRKVAMTYWIREMPYMQEVVGSIPGDDTEWKVIIAPSESIEIKEKNVVHVQKYFKSLRV